MIVHNVFYIKNKKEVEMIDTNCGWIQTVLAVLILVFAIWPTQIFSATVSTWIVIVSAVLLLIHAVICKKCDGICAGMVKDKISKKK